MANPILGRLSEEVTQTRTVIQSAITLIDGIRTRIDTAVAAAISNGATEEELAPLVDLESGLETDRTALANAVAANP